MRRDPFRTSLIRFRTGSISTLPSLYSTSSFRPGFNPARSRISLGITNRPARSMVVYMP